MVGGAEEVPREDEAAVESRLKIFFKLMSKRNDGRKGSLM